jgi:hypothetical protein
MLADPDAQVKYVSWHVIAVAKCPRNESVVPWSQCSSELECAPALAAARPTVLESGKAVSGNQRKTGDCDYNGSTVGVFSALILGSRCILVTALLHSVATGT